MSTTERNGATTAIEGTKVTWQVEGTFIEPVSEAEVNRFVERMFDLLSDAAPTGLSVRSIQTTLRGKVEQDASDEDDGMDEAT